LPPLIASIKEALDDRILQVLGVFAFLTLVTGMIANKPRWGWLEGASIFFAMFIIISISSLNDWIKDK